MIIRRLHLHPFAGTADRDQEFQPGLNVILGPNEAGKTTLRNALWQVLFVSTKLNKRDAERFLHPYLPLGGGDTVRVSAELEAGGESWQVSKRWSPSGSASELTLPDGGIVTDVGAVDTTLAGLLTLNEGTWRYALFASQGRTESALENIVGGSPLDDLNEVLRRAGFETDGVSIEALGSEIEDRWKGAFGRWDRERNRPENNRGLENPWSRNVGSILQAWYEREEARQALGRAEAYYRDLDAITQKLNDVSTTRESLEDWVAEYAGAATDAGRRRLLEADLGRVKAREGVLREVSQEWPVNLSKAAELEGQAADLEKRADELAEEQRTTQAWEEAGQKRTILGQAKSLQSRIAEARGALDNTPEVTENQIEELEGFERERDLIRTRLEAAKLGVAFRAKEAMDIEFQPGVEPVEQRSLAGDEVLEFTAGGRAAIRHADWEVEVRSGDIDVAVEETRYREIEKGAADLLKAIGAEDLQGAKELRNSFRERARHLSSLQEQIKELLGDQTLEEIQAEVQSTGGGKAPERSSAVVAAERATAEAGAERAGQAAIERRQRIQEWVDEFGSPDDLLNELVAHRGERMELEKKVEGLLPLPEGFDDAALFLEKYETEKSALEQANGVHNDLLVDKATVEGTAPDVEPAEAAELRDQKEAGFERALRQGEAIDRIQRDFEALREEMDEDTLQPWLEHFAEVVAPISGQRYRAIDLEGSTFSHADTGMNVPFQVLSMGTRACLGLAVRLSMARWFLRDRKGFLVLDDPLVDLDPERQEDAAAMLKTFAEDKQVILLTCHPRHAEILGGETIQM